MKQMRKSRWFLAATVLTAGLISARPLYAQFPAGQDGHALDANNRVGSNGYNGGGVSRGPAVTGNQIVNGNVTRGQEFRGAIGHPDARAFRGPTALTGFDRFVSGSSGAAARGQANDNSFSAQPFYGGSRAVAPPPGYIPLGYTGGYTAASNAPAGFNLARQGGFTSTYGSSLTGDTPLNGALGTTIITDTTANNNDPNNPSSQNGQNALLLSPLSGIQSVPMSDALGSSTSAMSKSGNYVRGNPFDRARTDNRTIEQMRLELEQANPNAKDPNNTDDAQSQTPAAGQFSNKLPQAIETPGSGKLSTGRLNVTPVQQQQLTGTVRPTDAAQKLPSQEQQSSLLSDLSQRLKRYEADAGINNVSDQGATAAKATPKPGTAAPGATPGALAGGPTVKYPGGVRPTVPGAPGSRPPMPGAPNTMMPGMPGVAKTPGNPQGPTPGSAMNGAPSYTDTPKARGPKPAPVVVTSLAAGVKAKGLADLMKKAEDLMKEGKFADAMERYDVAEQVAPNNSLISLGKAHAELGASSYRSADAHIRAAVAANRSLLLARYDLRTFMGADRYQIVISDLRDLNKSNPEDPIPAFLLAYVSYNAGDIVETVTNLNEAERRSGGTVDPTLRLMREYWSLPTAKTPAAAPASLPSMLNNK